MASARAAAGLHGMTRRRARSCGALGSRTGAKGCGRVRSARASAGKACAGLRGGGAPVVRCSNAVNGLRAELLSAKEQEMHWGAYSGSGSGWNAAQVVSVELLRRR